MHGTIYEITKEVLDKEDWAHEGNFYEDENVDYTTLLDEEDRTLAINDLFEASWFKSLFSKGIEHDSIVYNGELGTIKEEWYKCIKFEVDELKSKKILNTYKLRKTLNNPLNTESLFCLPEWIGFQSCQSRDLVEWLDTLEPGTVLHINSVFDYHW